jgi:RecA/RadA recombinase
LVEFCGDSQSGKTHVALKTIAEFTSRKRRCAFLNPETSFYEPRAAALGVPTRDHNLFEYYGNIATAELYGELLIKLVESGQYGCIVVDSISAMIPEVEANKKLSQTSKIGAHATLMGRLTKRLLSLCDTTKTTVIMINQFRMGQGVLPGQMVKTPMGGASVGYFCHMRIWFDRIKSKAGKIIGDGDEEIGGKTKVTVVKTRFGKPGVSAIFPIYFEEAKPNYIAEFLYLAQAKGKEFITCPRKKYTYTDKDTGEILAESKDPVEFIQQLMAVPSPTNRTKGDDSTTAFEYITGRLKYTLEQVMNLNNALEDALLASYDEDVNNEDVDDDSDESSEDEE